MPIKVFNIKELYRDGRPLAGDRVELTMQERRFPGTDQVPIPLCARLVYVVRTIDFGDKTVIEGDDSVEFQRRSLGPISATLVPPVEFRTYDLGEHGGSGVSIETRDGRVESLELGDFASASELRGWLTRAYEKPPPATPITVAGRPLLLGGNPLSVRDLRRLIVRSAAVSPAAPSQPQDCTPVP